MAEDTFSASDFESAASASSEPAADTSTPETSPASVETTAQPEGATTQPAVATTASPSTEPVRPAGPIPFDVHKTALDNARQKATAEWDQQYGWAKQVNPQEFQQVVEMARRASSDPIAYLQDFIKELQSHPEHSAQLRSLAARALSQRQQQAQDEQEPQPDLPIQLEDGRVVHLYSAQQQAKREAFLQQQWLSQVEQKFQPVTQTIQNLQAREAAAVKQQEITNFVSTTFNDVQTWPGMDQEANRVAVANELARARVNSDDPREVSLALNAAYRKAVLPTLHTASRQAVLNDINRQAAASTVNPAQTSTRAPKSIDEMSIAEALRHVAAQNA